jgi:nucleotide-binding universal stress UspA family protein
VVDIEIICLNIYQLPQGYTTSGKSMQEFAEIMKKNAQKRYQHFMKQFSLDGIRIAPRFHLDTDDAFAKIIFNIGLIEDVDMIVIGSRGRTNLAAVFLEAPPKSSWCKTSASPPLC